MDCSAAEADLRARKNFSGSKSHILPARDNILNNPPENQAF